MIYLSPLKATFYLKYYFLANGIFCQVELLCSKNSRTSRCKEDPICTKATCKDVKYCFAVLLAPFKIIKNSCPQWNIDTIDDIMLVCYIMDNMVIDGKRDLGFEVLFDPNVHPQVERGDLEKKLQHGGDWIYVWTFCIENLFD